MKQWLIFTYLLSLAFFFHAPSVNLCIFTFCFKNFSFGSILSAINICPLLCPSLYECSVGISNFLEEISSFSFYCFLLFLCTDHWGRLSCLSLWVQGQRSFRKMVGTGVAADFEEIPHVQEQRRRPSKMVGGANSCLESNLIPASEGSNLVHTRTQRPYRDWDRTVSGVSCGVTGLQWSAAGAGALGAVDLGVA